MNEPRSAQAVERILLLSLILWAGLVSLLYYLIFALKLPVIQAWLEGTFS